MNPLQGNHSTGAQRTDSTRSYEITSMNGLENETMRKEKIPDET